MKLRTIRQLKNLKGKRVLLRVDFNVAVKNDRVPKEEMIRIGAALPTIQWLTRRGARVILLTHLGRPDGKRSEKYSTKPLAAALKTALHQPIQFSPEVIGSTTEKMVANLKNGEILLLENLRFYPGEEENSPAFAKKLASLGDCYVNDAFAVSHRVHASVVGITKWLPSYAGLLIESEISHLSRLTKNPKRPYIVVMGGAKISTKMPVLKNLFPIADKILIGGGLATTIWDALGYGVGASLVEEQAEKYARQIAKNKKVVLPIDAIVTDASNHLIDQVSIPRKPQQLCDERLAIVDVGPETIKNFSRIMSGAKTIVWNGPVGKTDLPQFARGTRQIARIIAQHSTERSFSVVGGGDTISQLHGISGVSKIDFISTGGGAMLEYLSGKILPGLRPLYLP